MDVNHRILVVCEDTPTLERLGTYLGEQGYAVQCAADLQDALMYGGTWNPELIISEYSIGSLRGLDLIETIRRVAPRARFILITPPGETPEYGRAAPNRIIAFLGKPFNPEDLMHYVLGSFSAGDSQFNRREHSRHSFTIEAHLTLINPFDHSEGRPVASLMRDVSRSGITMIVRQLVPVPAMLRITFQLAGQQLAIPMLAKSMSCMLTQIPGVYRMGAKFIGLLPRELEKAFVKMSADPVATQKDIFMGKSFREAALEWLEIHRNEVVPGDIEYSQHMLSEIAAEFARDHDEEGRI